MPRSVLFVSASLLVIFAAGGSAVGAGTRIAGAANAATGGEVPACLKKLGMKGRPHKFNTVASINAVRAWTQKAMDLGEEYSIWHKAEGSNIKCTRLDGSEYYVCFASAKPCRASEEELKAARNSG